MAISSASFYLKPARALDEGFQRLSLYKLHRIKVAASALTEVKH